MKSLIVMNFILIIFYMACLCYLLAHKLDEIETKINKLFEERGY